MYAGFRYNFKKGHTGPVQIDTGLILQYIVQTFARIFFQVNPVQQNITGSLILNGY